MTQAVGQPHKAEYLRIRPEFLMRGWKGLPCALVSRRTGEAYAKAREDADALQKQGEERLQELRAEEKAALDAKTPELAALLAAQLLGEEE